MNNETTEMANEIPLEDVVPKPTTLGNDQEPEQPPNNKNLYIAAVIGCLMTMSAGIGFGWTSPVLPRLIAESTDPPNPLQRRITSIEVSCLAGLICLGAIVGPFAAGPLAQKIGRRKSLLLISMPLSVSFVILAYASTIQVFYVARVLSGVGAGAVFTVLPMYVGEIATDQNRGALGCLMSVFTTAGFLFVYALGPFFSIQNFCFLCTAPLTLFSILCYFWSPESPTFLASIGDQKGAEASLVKLRNTKSIHEELAAINKNLEELGQNKGTFLDLFKYRNLRRGLTISVGLISLQQLTGINPVLAYMQDIFAAAGSNLEPAIAVIIVGVVQVTTTGVSSLLVEKLGRRILLLTSIIGSGFSLLVLGLYFYLKANNYDVRNIGWLPITSLIAYILVFSLGLQPMPWAILGELFPSSVKSPASAISSSSCFVSASISTILFPILVDVLGMATCLWGFAVVCGLGTLFIYFIVPETKGKSLQEIQKLLAK